MKILICGSREDFDEDRAKEYLTEFIRKHRQEQFIHGGARGIDSLANSILGEYKINAGVFPPDYEIYGRRAPIVRDMEMVEQSDVIAAFWNLESRGTKFTIDYAKKKGKPVEVFDIRKFKGPSTRLGV